MSDNRGYAGLFASADKNQMAKDNLVVAEKLSNFTDNKRKEEEENQAKVGLMQDEIKKQTDQLLGYDRKKLREIQTGALNTLKNQIAANGGDYSRFMNNGGRAILDNYKSSILNSDLYSNYQENQKNMQTILELEKKGMGHLINPVDRANMNAYQRNKGGKISYTGQMMQVELPDGRNYDWNTNAPVKDILSYKDNYTKIMENYRMSFPGLKQPPSQEDLNTYVRSQYSVRGTDWQRGANERDFAASEDQRKIGNNQWDATFKENVFKDRRDFKEDGRRYELDRQDRLYTEELNFQQKFNSAMNNQDGTISNGIDKDAQESQVSNVGIINELIDDGNVSITDFRKPEFWNKVDGQLKERGSEMNYSKFNLSSNHYGNTTLGRKLAPANARFINNLDGSAAASASLNGKFEVKGNKVLGVVTKDQNWFGADGRVISDKASSIYKFFEGSKPRDLTIKGVASVATFFDGKGNENIVMDKHNYLGGKNKTYEDDINTQVKNTKVKMKQMVVLQADSGELVYMPFNTNDAPTRQRYSDITKSDNITPQRKAYKNSSNQITNYRDKEKKQAEADINTYTAFINDAPSNVAIKKRSAILGDPLNPSKRAPLLVAYYATLASMGQDPSIYKTAVNGDSFEKLLSEAKGKNTNGYSLMKGNLDDQQIIRQLSKLDQNGQSDFYDNWIKNYQNLKNLK